MGVGGLPDFPAGPTTAADVRRMISDLAAWARRHFRFAVQAPLHRRPDGSVEILGPRPLLARLSGSGSPYGYAAAQDASPTFPALSGGRTGSDAFEANGLAGLAGKVVTLYPSTVGDWRFQWDGDGPGEGCVTRICVVANDCNGEDPSDPIDVGVTIRDGGGTVVATGATGDDGEICFEVEPGTYHVSATSDCGSLTLNAGVVAAECETTTAHVSFCCVTVCADINPEPDTNVIGGVTISGNGCAPSHLSIGLDGNGDCDPGTGSVYATKTGYWDRAFCYDAICGAVNVTGTLFSRDTYARLSCCPDDCHDWADRPANMIPKVLAITLSGTAKILGRWAGVPIEVYLSGSDDGTGLAYSSGCLTQSGAKYYEWYYGGICGMLIEENCLNFNYNIPDRNHPYEYKSCRVSVVIHCGEGGSPGYATVQFLNFTGDFCLSADPGSIHLDGGLFWGEPYEDGCLLGCDCGTSPAHPPAQGAYARGFEVTLDVGSICSPVNISGATATTPTNLDAGCPGGDPISGVLTE